MIHGTSTCGIVRKCKQKYEEKKWKHVNQIWWNKRNMSNSKEKYVAYGKFIGILDLQNFGDFSLEGSRSPKIWEKSDKSTDFVFYLSKYKGFQLFSITSNQTIVDHFSLSLHFLDLKASDSRCTFLNSKNLKSVIYEQTQKALQTPNKRN